MVKLIALSLTVGAAAAAAAQTSARSVIDGQRPNGRFAIRNAIIVQGNGTPAEGPYDIVVDGNRIVEMVAIDPVALKSGRARRPEARAEIDAGGRHVLPGLIDTHAHLQNERDGVPQPYEYQFKLWLASGITTIRDVSAGGDPKELLDLKARSAAGTLEAPRMFIYAGYSRPPFPANPDEARQRVRDLKAAGVDGIKITGLDRDQLEAMEDEARKAGLPIAHHVGVEETTAWDDIKFGIRSLEHWYGVPDAAFKDGVQSFPADFNYRDRPQQLRYAGRIWREADPARLQLVLKAMVDNRVHWDPTLVVFEACRDLQRARTQPWFKDYLHPSLEESFKPVPEHHGAYLMGWSSTDEAFWKENFRIWMATLRDFERMGGVIGVGDDAGYLYQMYGFAAIREMELHQEAGFHPLKVIQHATLNNAIILGQEAELGRLRVGHLADLIVVNGNPLEDLKVLYPTGTTGIKDGREVKTGGVEWTIKDGVPYHGPRLLREVKDLVMKARSELDRRP